MSAKTLPGLLARKLGMLTRYDDSGRAYGATVLQCDLNVVTQLRTTDRDGYTAIQVGTRGDKKNTTRAERGHLKSSGQDDAQITKLSEFRVDSVEDYNLGDSITVDRFRSGMYVDVTARTKGRGFQGTVKRWNFAGGPKTHGQSDRWRAPGSIGAGTSPGRVFKGTRMSGHMGNRVRTVLNQLVIEVDLSRGLIFVAGNVPGPIGALVEINEGRRPAIEPVKVVVEPEPIVEEPAAAVDDEIPAEEPTAAVDGETPAEEPAAAVDDEIPAEEPTAAVDGETPAEEQLQR